MRTPASVDTPLFLEVLPGVRPFSLVLLLADIAGPTEPVGFIGSVAVASPAATELVPLSGAVGTAVDSVPVLPRGGDTVVAVLSFVGSVGMVVRGSTQHTDSRVLAVS